MKLGLWKKDVKDIVPEESATKGKRSFGVVRARGEVGTETWYRKSRSLEGGRFYTAHVHIL